MVLELPELEPPPKVPVTSELPPDVTAVDTAPELKLPVTSEAWAIETEKRLRTIKAGSMKDTFEADFSFFKFMGNVF